MALDSLKVSSRDFDGIPYAILITFSSGDEVRYVRNEGVEEKKSDPITKRLPKYNFGDFKSATCDLRAQYAVCTKTLRKMMNTFKKSLVDAGELREKAKAEIDLEYQKWERNLRNDYSSQKKKWESLKRELEVPEGRLRIVVKQLKEANLKNAPAVITMLENEADFLAKKMELMDLKYETFLSHVQKCSSDLCGRLSDALTHAGITSWYDMYASKLDVQGMIEGVLNSRIFTVILTKDYFQRQYCLFEYSIAVMAGKPVLVIYEWDKRFEGGRLDEFDIPEVFKETIMDHEIIKIDRRQWRSFFSSFERGIKAKQNYVSVFTDSSEKVRRSSNILQNKSDINFLKGTLDSSGWKFGERIFSSTADGFTAQSFHDKCDDMGATLTVAKRKSGLLFGAFLPFSYKKSSGWGEAQDAWLFDLENNRAPKLLDVEHGEVLVFCAEVSGPYMKMNLTSGGKIEFGVHGCKSGAHFVNGVFAGSRIENTTTTIDIEEYEVFQILKTDVRGSV